MEQVGDIFSFYRLWRRSRRRCKLNRSSGPHPLLLNPCCTDVERIGKTVDVVVSEIIENHRVDAAGAVPRIGKLKLARASFDSLSELRGFVNRACVRHSSSSCAHLQRCWEGLRPCLFLFFVEILPSCRCTADC